MNQKQLYESLLETWAVTLKRLQLTQVKDEGLYGGILCPSCSRIHGRTMDAMYPFLAAAKLKNDHTYIDAAQKVFRWAQHVYRDDGGYIGETNHAWKGITVFSVIQLAHCLKFHSDLLEPKVLDEWRRRLKTSADYLYDSMTIGTGNINYPITSAASFALAAQVLDDKKYLPKAYEFAHSAIEYLTPNHLIFGEGAPQTGVTPKGCRAVDIGYNVEESLTGLVLYALCTGDTEVREAVEKSMRSHLNFMLPDGAWDNSFGTRNFKWTYWGSRTSDGCQAAYGLLGADNPEFARAALQNARLLNECTHDGFLYGGPDYYRHGEIPCVHHTLFHAKAMATLLDYGVSDFDEKQQDKEILPRETAQGVLHYPEVDTYLAAEGDWRATVTGYDWEYEEASHASGGTLSMLWNKNWGTVLCADLTQYSMIEENNMQLPIDSDHECITPRIVYKDSAFQSISDISCKLYEMPQKDGIARLCAEGQLVNAKHETPPDGEVNFTVEYAFEQNKVTMSITCTKTAQFILPIISHGAEYIRESVYAVCYKNGKNTLRVTANNCISNGDDIFNLVPGFIASPIKADISQNTPLVITLEVL